MSLLPFQKKKGVMIDIETLSTRTNACITSIGAVKFDLNGSKIFDKFKVNIDPKSCKDFGLHFGKSTIDWWSTQTKEARAGWQSNPVPLPLAIQMFDEFWGNDKYLFWCNGLSFDAPIMTNAYLAIGREEGIKPWTYREEMDLRTVYSLVGFNSYEARKKRSDVVYHDALDDAIFQTECLFELFGY